MSLRRYEESLTDFNQASAQDSNISNNLIAVRGLIYQSMGRYEEALADLDQALAQDDKHVMALKYRAEIYQSMGRYEEALADLDQALAQDDSNMEMIKTRAKIYRALGRYEEALSCFNQMISLNATAIDEICMSRGLVLSYLGQYAEAIENYKQGFINTPNNYRSQYNIAVAIIKWKGLPNSQAYIDSTRSILLPLLNTQERGAALYGMGALEALVDNKEQANDYLEQAIFLEKEAIDWAQHDIAWLNLRTNPRFQMLISRNELTVDVSSIQ